jgi:hypothetical protein
MLDEAHEGLDGSETHVSGAGTIASLYFKVLEKSKDQCYVELLQQQLRGNDS